MKKLLLSLISILFATPLLYSDISITQGSGTTIGTDAPGSVNYQKIKITDGSPGSTTMITGSANGLRVDLSSTNANSVAINVVSTGTVLATGSNSIGSITNTGFNVNNSPTIVLTTAAVNGSTVAVVNGGGTKLLVTPDSVALPANQSVNINQINGASPVGNNTMANSVPVTIASNQTSIGIAESTQPVNNVGTAIVFISTFANVAASQTNQGLVGLIASTKICVHSVVSVSGGTATTLLFTTSSGGSISATFANGINGGEVLPWSPVPWFCSLSGEGLGATTGAGSTTGIQVLYGKE